LETWGRREMYKICRDNGWAEHEEREARMESRWRWRWVLGGEMGDR
jgi:hypothetical protein